jgi:hypothetical protein
VAEIVKGQKDDDEPPVQDAEQNEKTDKRPNFHNAPKGIFGTLSLDFSVDRLGVVAQITEKNVTPNVFRFVIMTMAIDRQPIDGVSMFVAPVAVSHVMAMMNVLVKSLGKAEAKRLYNPKNTIERSPREIGVVQEIMRDPIDIPGDAYRVDDPHADDYPPRSNGKNREKGQHIGKVQKAAQRRHNVPF